MLLIVLWCRLANCLMKCSINSGMSWLRSTSRGSDDRHHLQPVIQIAAKRAGRDRILQVAVRGREDAHVDLDRIVRADARDLAALQHAQQLDLRGHRHVADFVEKQRAAVGVFELADPIGRGVGERPADVAEQLAFQDVLAQRGAVQGDERLVLARAVLMDRLRDQFLAGAGLALDQHAGVGRGDPLQAVDHLVHLRAGADHPLEAEFFVQPAVQFGVRPPQPQAGRGFFGDGPQLAQIERLEQIVERPLLHGRHGRGDRAVAGDQDHLGVGQGLLGAGQDLQPVDVVHHQVGDDDVERLLLDQLGPLRAGGGHGAVVADALQAFGDGLGVRGVVVDDQHANVARRGLIGGMHDCGGRDHATDNTRSSAGRIDSATQHQPEASARAMVAADYFSTADDLLAAVAAPALFASGTPRARKIPSAMSPSPRACM